MTVSRIEELKKVLALEREEWLLGKRRSLFVFVLAVLVFTGVVVVFLGPQFGRPTFGTVRRQGDAINRALEKYKLDHGSYPDSLKVLVPDYLESISKPRVFGRQLRLQLSSRAKWQYRLSDGGNEYVLWISNSSEFGYRSENGEWSFFAGGEGESEDDTITTSSE